MTVIGISMVKDEADIIETTVRHMLSQVDAVIVADNGSTDGTREILLDRFPIAFGGVSGGQVWVVDDPEPGYYQSRKMSDLAAAAARAGATWVVPFDADEIWVPRERSWGTIRDVLSGLPASESTAPATLFNHVATAADPPSGDPVARIGWRTQDPGKLPKVACRPLMPVRIHQGNHGADYGTSTPSPILVVHHYPYRSAEQMIRKVRNGAAAYRATDLPVDQGAHWRGYDAFDDDAIAGIFRKWFWRASPNASSVVDGETLLPLVYEPPLAAARII